jgi:hypothetical protein
MEQLESPILFLIFNRPDLTETVFKRIRDVKPKHLFIAADGPRKGNESDALKCEETRKAVLSQIDWDCDLRTLFRENNLGCGNAVSQAITWFFEEVEMGIILEDDCLPDFSFFCFCQEMLSYYSDDKRIMMISGLNICNHWKSDIQSYHFSYFGGVWGWATWKRSWKLFDFNIELWNSQQIQNLLLSKYFSHFKKERVKLYSQLYNKEIDTWDIQWGFCRLINSGLSIIPSKNLVTNIGFRADSTHTKKRPGWYDIEPHVLRDVRTHDFVLADKEYDEIHLALTHGSKKCRKYKLFKF